MSTGDECLAVGSTDAGQSCGVLAIVTIYPSSLAHELDDASDELRDYRGNKT